MNRCMAEESWSAIEFFTPEENWGDWKQVNERLIFALDKARAVLGKSIVLNCAFENTGHNPQGYHPRGMAADIHVPGMHVVDQYLFFSKFPDFGGIGIYPFWIRPGLHVDIGQPGRRWARNKSGVYVALDWAFLKTIK